MRPACRALDHEDLAGDPYQIVEHLDAVRVDVMQRRHREGDVVLVVGERRQYILGRTLVDDDVLQLRIGLAQQGNRMRVDLDALEIGVTVVVQVSEVASDPAADLQDLRLLGHDPVEHGQQRTAASRVADERRRLVACRLRLPPELVQLLPGVDVDRSGLRPGTAPTDLSHRPASEFLGLVNHS